MNRMWGGRQKRPEVTLDSIVDKNEATIGKKSVDYAKFDEEFRRFGQQANKYPAGSVQRERWKKKARVAMQRRDAIEAHQDQLMKQTWNLEQMGMMRDNLKNTMDTVEMMKKTQKQLRKEYGKIDIDKIERMQDEIADLMDMSNEIQESISRSYDVPDEIDDAELDAELEALGDEIDMEADFIGEEAAPGFLNESAGLPSFIDEPVEPSKTKEAAT